jgi:hypothetical protein
MVRHSTDLVSLTFGILFATIGVVLLLGQLDTIRLDWVIPTATVVLGVLLIVLARPTRTEPDDEPTDA